MHGDLSQFQRERVLNKFRKKICTVLVVTDVASRGLDITGLSHVINFALPQDVESYVHRIGRTGRAGKSGTAITFITPSEFRKIIHIQKATKTEMKKGDIPDVPTVIETKKKRLTKTIYDCIEKGPGNDYLDYAEELLATHNPKLALASVLKIAFEEEFSEKNYTELKKGKSKRDNRDSFDSGRRDYPKRDRRQSGGKQNSKQFVDMKGQTRLFVAKGKMDHMDPKKLVMHIEKKSGVFGKRIQGVQIYDKFSFINVSYKDAERIIGAFKSEGNNKRPLIERAK